MEVQDLAVQEVLVHTVELDLDLAAEDQVDLAAEEIMMTR